jgi:NAD(P)-dependent dehydrogenase (short-subunit alcohol dehydrogenase family)
MTSTCEIPAAFQQPTYGMDYERRDVIIPNSGWRHGQVKVVDLLVDVLEEADSAGAEAAIAKLPAVDVLVNNVGIFEPKPFGEIPDADWYRFFRGST